MKSKLLILAVCLIFTLTSSDTFKYERGKIIEGLTMSSSILGKSVNYSVYLPYDYETSKRSYPVVYLLHGYTDNETAWVQFGQVHHVLDKKIALRELPEMIVVMPDAGVTWYINDFKNKVRYEDMFVEEFIPYIDKTYRTRATKEFRGITGLSMGGYGSLLYAMKHPNLFAASAPLSAAIYHKEEVIKHKAARWEKVESILYGKDLKGEDRITAHWKANNPFYLADSSDKRSLREVKYYFDCGDDDFLYKGNSLFHVKLRDMNIKHEFRIRDGKHNWQYWRTGIGDALVFIGNQFRR